MTEPMTEPSTEPSTGLGPTVAAPAGTTAPARTTAAEAPDSWDALPDALIGVDADRRITRVNRAASRLIGYRPGALLGQDCAAFLRVRDAGGVPVWASGWHRSTRLRSVRGLTEQSVRLRRADGRDLLTTVTGTYLRHGGAVVGAVLAFRDAARRADQAVGGIEIVSTVSHELRSPLTSVKGYTSLLLNRWDRLSDEQKRMMLEQVNHDADRVTRLISELLDISRLETGRLTLRWQLVDLPRLAATVVEKVGLAYPELDARVEFPPGYPRVYADPDKVEQVLTNLVENACKYASPREIHIAGSASEAGLSVRVTDRGEGIPAADLPKVFTKFFRRSEGRPTGSGLGLWISRGLVEAHGGRLLADSIVGQGSSFSFTLPVVDLEELTPP
ncbi:MAG: sensor histidine kinase [Acidimicrobiales bacterium]